jgi:hypothetical protein
MRRFGRSTKNGVPARWKIRSIHMSMVADGGGLVVMRLAIMIVAERDRISGYISRTSRLHHQKQSLEMQLSLMRSTRKWVSRQ